jgi:hypothetical protein
MLAVTAPAAAPDVAGVLLEYLKLRLKTDDLRFAEQPAPVPDGWETFIYRFRPESLDRLPAAFTRPLILRAYSSKHGLPRARHEFAVQCYAGVAVGLDERG